MSTRMSVLGAVFDLISRAIGPLGIVLKLSRRSVQGRIRLKAGGGGGNRLVSRGSRYIARPLGQRQPLLDSTLAYPVLAPSGAKPLRLQQACLLQPHLRPRVDAG